MIEWDGTPEAFDNIDALFDGVSRSGSALAIASGLVSGRREIPLGWWVERSLNKTPIVLPDHPLYTVRATWNEVVVPTAPEHLSPREAAIEIVRRLDVNEWDRIEREWRRRPHRSPVTVAPRISQDLPSYPLTQWVAARLQTREMCVVCCGRLPVFTRDVHVHVTETANVRYLDSHPFDLLSHVAGTLM